MIGKNVVVGNNVKIHPYVYIDGNVIIEDNVEIFPFAVIGTPPEHKYAGSNERGRVYIGEGTIIREGTIITMPTGMATYIGKRCYLMGNSHVGHDCSVYDDAILGGNAMLAGHSIVMDGAFIGDNAVVHQWSVVGSHAMVGMATPVKRNVLPFTTVWGSPPRWYKLNRIGFDRWMDSVDGVDVEAEWEVIRSMYSLPIKCLKTLGDLASMKRHVDGAPFVIGHVERFIEYISAQEAGDKTLLQYGGLWSTNELRFDI